MLLSNMTVVSLNLQPRKYPNKAFSVANVYMRNCVLKNLTVLISNFTPVITRDWEKVETSLTIFKLAKLKLNEGCNRNNTHWNFNKSA